MQLDEEVGFPTRDLAASVQLIFDTTNPYLLVL
jgi:hypothetical protein